MTAAAAPRLILFTRFPEPGRAKTRLIPALGAEGAAALHRRLTERTIATLQRTGLALEIWGTGAPLAAMRTWLGDSLDLRSQPDGDLGIRMAAAIGDGPAILVGSDLPTLSADHVAEAAAVLAAGMVALGPAEDGGYYLIGLPRPTPILFGSMTWSTPDVLTETRRRLAEHGIPYKLLATLPDLDRPEDLRRFPDLLA